MSGAPTKTGDEWTDVADQHVAVTQGAALRRFASAHATQVVKHRAAVAQRGLLVPSLEDVVWANVRIWQVRDELLTRIKKGLESEDAADRKRLEDIGQTITDDPLPDFATNALTIAQRPTTRNGDQFRNEIAKRYSLDKDDLDETEAGNAFGIAKGIISARDSRPDEYYIVTSRVEEGVQPRIIALLGMKRNIAESSLNIKFVKGGSEVYSWLTANRTDTTIYGEMKQAVTEPGSVLVKNMTNEMRDLSKLNFTAVTKARASYLDEGKYPYILTSITEGRPLRAEPKESAPDDSSGAEEETAEFVGNDVVVGIAVAQGVDEYGHDGSSRAGMGWDSEVDIEGRLVGATSEGVAKLVAHQAFTMDSASNAAQSPENAMFLRAKCSF